MNEFVKLRWNTKDLGLLEQQAQDAFITEDIVADSLVYKHFQNRKSLCNRGNKRTQKIFNQKEYIPGDGFQLGTTVKSVMDEYVHQHCLNALKLFQCGKDTSCFTTDEQYNIEFFKKFKPKIIEENSKYQSFVQYQWNIRDCKQILKFKPGLLSFGKQTWQEKWKKIILYPKFYREMSTFNLTFNENESIIDFQCVNNVLELGVLARFSHPNLKSPCHLKTVTLPLQGPEQTKCVYSNLSVSQDENVMKILENNNVDLVISASSLKCITDTSNSKRRWMIPVVVKRVSMKKGDGGTMEKNVVFLDKPFAQNHISYVDLANISYKRLLKTNFCQFEAFRYGKEDATLKEEDKVDYNTAFMDSNPFDKPRNRHHNTIHHNANYRIWNVKKTDCQSNLMKNRRHSVEFNVLIRSKLDACEFNEQGALQPVILKPKLEMQLRYGANIPTKAELANEWTSLFFTPFSNLYRVRISPISGEVICVEKCTIHKVVAESQAHYQYKPQVGLGILQKVFEELTHLEPGRYLLQHLPKHEAFVAILKEAELTNSTHCDVFDFHAEYDKVILDKFPMTWLPIDVNFVLPSFEAINRMPGMFTPRKPFVKGDKFKKKKKSKGNDKGNMDLNKNSSN